MKLTLLRHGITKGNRDHLCYGSTDLPLLEEGKEALRVAVKTYSYPKAQHYYTSGMRRTEETFRIIYGDTPHRVLPGLREVNFGQWEMMPFMQIKEKLQSYQWEKDLSGMNSPPEGESFISVRRRVLTELKPLICRGEDSVCVLHAGAMSTAMSLWFPEENIWKYMPNPGTGFQIIFEGTTPIKYFTVPEED